MTSIFISYRREDSPQHVERLAKDLRRAFGDSSVFTDTKNIHLAEDFLEVIRKSLKDRDVILVVIGPRWTALMHDKIRKGTDPDYVATEVAAAMKYGMTVLPVFVGGARMPSRKHLPAFIRPLANRNGITLSDQRWKQDVRRLCGFLKTAEYRSSAKRGFRPWQLVLSAILNGALTFAVVGGILGALATKVAWFGVGKTLSWEKVLEILIPTIAYGAGASAFIALAHWFLLRKTRIVIKRSVWRSNIRQWSVLTILGLYAAPHFEKANMPTAATIGVAIAGAIGVGAIIGLLEVRKLRWTHAIGCRTALVLWIAWSAAGLGGVGALIAANAMSAQ